MDGLTQTEQRELQSRLERKQMGQFMTMYSNLVQKCFDHCVDDFTSKSLSSKEEGCVMRCVDKFMKSSERLGQRFQEQNAAMAQSGNMIGRPVERCHVDVDASIKELGIGGGGDLELGSL